MKPFFFGRPDTRLLGVFHPSAGGGHGRGVALCYPIGQEYVRIHRTFRQLAVQLARRGFDVLRFDYYGTGDSAGNSSENRLDHWVRDISTAIEFLRESKGSQEIHLVGLRLGASLAFLSAAERNDIESIVLWEPIVHGKDEIQGILSPSTSDDASGASARLRMELEKLSLTSIERSPARRTLLIDNDPSGGETGLTRHLRRFDTRFDYRQVPDAMDWDDPNEFGQGRIPNQTVQSIIGWIAERRDG